MKAPDSYRMLLHGVTLYKTAIFIICNDCTMTVAHQVFQLLIDPVLTLVYDILEKSILM